MEENGTGWRKKEKKDGAERSRMKLNNAGGSRRFMKRYKQ